MALPSFDADFLAERGILHTVVSEAGMTCVLFPNWPLPRGYNAEAADLLLRLQTGYPDVAPDMWWFSPAIQLADGRSIPNADVTEQHLSRSWQRWSRHLQAGQWQSGIDGLESFLALIRRDLDAWAQRAA